jgi:hypothetical protein
VYPGLAVSVGEAADSVNAGSLRDGAQQFAERNFSLAAHKVIDVHFLVSFYRQAGVVSSHDDLHSRTESADQFNQASGGTPLKRHDGKADNFWIELMDESGDSLAYPALHQDQIGDGHAVLWINVSR